MESELSEIRIDKDPRQNGSGFAFDTNKINPEVGNPAKRKPSKSLAIKHKWNNFVEASTLHGLQYVFTSPTLFRRIIWALFVVVGITWFSFQSYRLLTKFFNYPVTTTVTLEYEEMPEFPAVSICNFNLFRTSAVNAGGYDEVLSYVMQRSLGLPGEAINWTKYENTNSSELYLLGGHQIEDTVVECSVSGERCGPANFTPVLTSMGLCYTFNSGKNGQPILKVREAGTYYGLRLMLNVEQYEYYSVLSYKAGLKVLIHHHDTPPMVDQLGFSVAPGTSTFAAIRKERVLNLPKPYKSKCSNDSVNDVPGYTTYTTAACLLTCQTKYVVKKCGCKSPGMPSNAQVCGPRKIVNCIFKEVENFRVDLSEGRGQCTCPVPCDTISYKQSLSYATFPSNNHVKSMAELFRSGGLANITEEEIKQQHEFIRQNFLELHVYFQELNYHFVEQEPAYNYESLLGEIGGQVGLCVGASLLTVLEFCDVTLTILGIRFGFR